MSNLLIVVPARGGSQRIPRKPLVEVCRRPLLWYTIEYVRRLGLSESTVVVTDDEEIACYATREGVGVVCEPLVVSHDENCLRAVYRAVLAVDQDVNQADIVVVLQPTQPVRPLDIVDRCVAALHGEADASLTVHPPKIPPELIAVPDGDLLQFSDYRRRQECPDYLCANGLCYAYQRDVFDTEPVSLSSFHRRRLYRGVVTDSFPLVDIDEPEDLMMFQVLIEGGHTMW